MSTKKKKSEITEERILEAALNIFAEKGYTASATSEIAKAAQVSEGTIFKYFPQKKDLLRRGVYKFIQMFGERVVMMPLEKIFEENSDAPPEVLLKKITINRIELFHSMKDHFKVLIMEMQYDEELRDIFVQHIVKKAAQFGEKIYNTFRERGIFRELPSITLLRAFIGSVAMLALQRELAPELTPKGLDIDEEIDIIIDILMNGTKIRGDQ